MSADGVSAPLAIPAKWAAPPGVRAWVTTRAGGVSTGGCASLNLALHVDDAPAAALENRRRVRESLALPAEPLWLRQVHGTGVVVHEGVDSRVDPSRPETWPEADAAVTFEPGRVLAIQTADCLPVVLASRDGGRLGAAHAGWRGLAGGVIERTVEALGGAGREFVAWLGPAIGRDAFEVGDEVREAFLAYVPPAGSLVAAAAARDAAARAFERNARGRWQADLVRLARLRLAALGVEAVAALDTCTHTEAARWYSHRRDPRSGRMATLAWIAG